MANIREEFMGKGAAVADIREELIDLFNQALQLEHAARIQYLAHAELIKGQNAEKLIERIKEIAGDEEKHEGMFRTIIGDYLDGEPTMAVAETHKARDIKSILDVNIRDEKHAIDLYKQIYKKINENKASLQYQFEKIEHELRHVILDEDEHVSELTRLLD